MDYGTQQSLALMVHHYLLEQRLPDVANMFVERSPLFGHIGGTRPMAYFTPPQSLEEFVDGYSTLVRDMKREVRRYHLNAPVPFEGSAWSKIKFILQHFYEQVQPCKQTPKSELAEMPVRDDGGDCVSDAGSTEKVYLTPGMPEITNTAIVIAVERTEVRTWRVAEVEELRSEVGEPGVSGVSTNEQPTADPSNAPSAQPPAGEAAEQQYEENDAGNDKENEKPSGERMFPTIDLTESTSSSSIEFDDGTETESGTERKRKRKANKGKGRKQTLMEAKRCLSNRLKKAAVRKEVGKAPVATPSYASDASDSSSFEFAYSTDEDEDIRGMSRRVKHYRAQQKKKCQSKEKRQGELLDQGSIHSSPFALRQCRVNLIEGRSPSKSTLKRSLRNRTPSTSPVGTPTKVARSGMEEATIHRNMPVLTPAPHIQARMAQYNQAESGPVAGSSTNTCPVCACTVKRKSETSAEPESPKPIAIPPGEERKNGSRCSRCGCRRYRCSVGSAAR